MTRPIEVSEELLERLERHAGEDDPVETFVEELVSTYEQEGRFLEAGL